MYYSDKKRPIIIIISSLVILRIITRLSHTKEEKKEIIEPKEEATVIVKSNNEADWFTYMKQNQYIYTQKPFDQFMERYNTFTRSSITPYLNTYAQNNNLFLNTENNCSFPDIQGLPDTKRREITKTCQYGLLRGSNGSFMPHKPLTKYELIIILVRSTRGILDENQSPRYQSYLEKAMEMNLIDPADIYNLRREDAVTLEELGEILYKKSKTL